MSEPTVQKDITSQTFTANTGGDYKAMHMNCKETTYNPSEGRLHQEDSSLLHSKYLADDYQEIMSFDERSNCYNMGLAFLIASGGYYFGYNIGIWNPLGEKHLIFHYGYTGVQNLETLGLINSLFAIGACLGCLSAGFFCERIGRFKTLWLVEILAI